MMEIVMRQDKVTKGAVRFADTAGHNIYFRKEEVAEMGDPQAIKVTIEPETRLRMTQMEK